MRHASSTTRLSRPAAPRRALLANMAKNVLRYGRVHTTVVKAKETRRVIEQLIGLGKEGSLHSRRQAYRLLQDRELVKRLFSDIAPQFLDYRGGYTRVLKLAPRSGDGASLALLELTRFPTPIVPPTAKTKARKAPTPEAPKAPATPEAGQEPKEKRKGFFEGLRERFRPKKTTAQS